MNLAELGPLKPEPVSRAAAEPSGTVAVAALSAPELAGQIGAEVAQPLSSALERVNLLATTGKIGRRSLRALREELEQARRVAMIGQQILRLASGRVRQAPEAVDLPRLLRDIATQRGREIEARGFELHKSLKPMSVQADATLTFALIQALLDWAFEHCCERLIQLTTDLRSWPVRVQLVCEFAWRHADQIDTEAQTEFDALTGDETPIPLDTLAWRLVQHTAQVMGVQVEREDSAWRTRVTLEFTKAVEADAPRLGGVEVEAGSTLNSRPLAGCHVLVVSGRREVRNTVREALRPMSLMVDYVTSQDTAREFCRGGIPHAVIFDAVLGPLPALREDLQPQAPNVAFIEVSEALNTLEVASHGSRHQARIGLDVVPTSLRSALEYALSP